ATAREGQGEGHSRPDRVLYSQVRGKDVSGSHRRLKIPHGVRLPLAAPLPRFQPLSFRPMGGPSTRWSSLLPFDVEGRSSPRLYVGEREAWFTAGKNVRRAYSTSANATWSLR